MSVARRGASTRLICVETCRNKVFYYNLKLWVVFIFVNLPFIETYVAATARTHKKEGFQIATEAVYSKPRSLQNSVLFFMLNSVIWLFFFPDSQKLETVSNLSPHI